MNHRLRNTTFIKKLSMLAEVLSEENNSDRDVLLNIERAKLSLASASKREIVRWLEMSSSDVKALDNTKLYAILSYIIPEIDNLSKQLEDLNYIMSMLKDNKLLPMMSKVDNTVLQFREILVATITAPQTNYAAVVKTLESKYPSLRKKISKIKKRNTQLVSRLLKTTIDKINANQAKAFPTKTRPTEIKVKGSGDVLKVAGLMATIQILFRRLRGNLIEMWEVVKDKFTEILNEIEAAVSSFNLDLESLNSDLKAYL